MSTLLATKFSVDTVPLRMALAAVVGVIKHKTPKPVLKNVRLDIDPENGTTLCATDLEVGIRIRLIGVAADRKFSVLLDPEKLTPILARTQGQSVDFSMEENTLEMRSSGYKFVFQTESAEMYPELPIPDFVKGHHEVTAADLRRLIRLTKYAADPGSGSKYALGGCLLELQPDGSSLALVATDGRRIAKATAPCDSIDGGGFLKDRDFPVLPMKSLQLIERNIEDEDPAVSFAITPNSAFFRSDRMTLSTRLVEGRYPRYQDVFPANSPIRVEFLTGELMERVALASVMTSETSRGIDFTLSSGLLTLKASTADRGNSDVEMLAAYEGKTVEWCLQGGYFLDALMAIGPKETMTLEVINAKSPILIRDAQFVYAMMPITVEP